MRNFDEFRKNYNDMKLRSGGKIFTKQVEGIEGVDVIIDDVPRRGLVHNNINPTSEKEYRSLHLPLGIPIKRGSYVNYLDEDYLVTTDIDNHYVYTSCKMQKCNQTLKWIQNGCIYEYPCIMANDSYGVKVLSDNDYIRSQNIKAQIVIQNNEDTRKIIQDMRFVFNHSENDIYGVVDINTSLATGVITLTMEKVVYQKEDDLENNLAFSSVLIEGNEQSKDDNDVNTSYVITGMDSVIHKENYQYSIEPLTKCTFYLDEFDALNIAEIVSQDNGSCEVYIKKIMSNTWFTLYTKDENDKVLCEKKIEVTKR